MVTDICICKLYQYFSDGLQQKGAMSTKPVFEKFAKIQRSYVPLCGHTTSAIDSSTYYDYY